MTTVKISATINEQVNGDLKQIFEELKKTDFNLNFSQVVNKILALGIKAYNNNNKEKTR